MRYVSLSAERAVEKATRAAVTEGRAMYVFVVRQFREFTLEQDAYAVHGKPLLPVYNNAKLFVAIKPKVKQ